jgi:hypothetical protein
MLIHEIYVKTDAGLRAYVKNHGSDRLTQNVYTVNQQSVLIRR